MFSIIAINFQTIYKESILKQLIEHKNNLWKNLKSKNIRQSKNGKIIRKYKTLLYDP